jgi:hypothetical protein
MAKLQDVFGRGLLSARPAAAKEGYHYFATDTGMLYRDSGSAWVAVAIPGLVFEFSTTTADADPGAGKLRFDNATPASVTTVRIDDQPHSSDADLSTVYAALSGARLLITQADDPAKYMLGLVGTPADGTGYYNLPITVEDSGTLPDNAALCSVVLIGGAAAAGGGTTQWWNRPAAPHGWTAQFVNRIISGNGTQPSLLGTVHQEGQSTTPSYGGDTDVVCGNVYDLSPAVTPTGLQWIQTYGDFGQGAYGLLQARWPVQALNNLFWGFKSTASMTIAPANTEAGCYFVKRTGDTNWQVAHAPGDGATAWTYVDTGVAGNTANWHNFELDIYNDGGTVKCKAYIDGVEVADITTNMPQGTKSMDRCYCVQIIDGSFDTVSNDIGFFVRGMKWIGGHSNKLADFA